VDRAEWAELATDYGEAARRHLQICRGDEIYGRVSRGKSWRWYGGICSGGT